MPNVVNIRVISRDGTASFQVEQGQNLLKVLLEHGMMMETPCGGRGTCGKCRVKVREAGQVSQTERLACQFEVHGDLEVEIPESEISDEALILTEGDSKVSLVPSVEKRYLVLDRPSVDDQAGDADRIEKTLGGGVRIEADLLFQLPEVLRRSDFRVTAAVMGDKVIALEGGDTSGKLYGLAFDIGTTTVVGYLMDLSSGEQIGVASSLNPQRRYGADVIARIDAARDEPGLKAVSAVIREEVNRMIGRLCQEHSISPENVYHIVLTGNTVMMHLFCGLPVFNIAVAPYIPVVTRGLEYRASELGIDECPAARVTVMPMVAAYVGADTIAALLASGLTERDELSLLIDIGTNGEIALGNRSGVIACSTAAGPAFEGAHIRCGLGGVRGAVDKVEISDGVSFTTIGGAPARGICGSGIVDAVAQLLRIGLIEPFGRLLGRDETDPSLNSRVGERLVEIDGKPAFLLAGKGEGALEDIYICQRDIREVQLAKAAIAAGIEILAEEMGVRTGDIDSVFLAGGFGNYIDKGHAAEIGLIPGILESQVIPIGNGAGAGARMVLLSKSALELAGRIREQVEYIELSSRKDFQDVFVEHMAFTRY